MSAERFFEVSLQRSGPDIPWGFRLTENSRFPTVVRVNPNGVSANVVKVGDLFLKIGNNFTEGRSYADVLQMIKTEGNELHVLIDRGAPSSLWSSTTSSQNSVTSPTDTSKQFFQPSQRSNDPDPKPFTYTTAPNQLAEELKMRHNAMRKERQQNFADTAAARSRMSERTDSPSIMQQRQIGSKVALSTLPRFTMEDQKDFTQSDVYRLLDMEARSPTSKNMDESYSSSLSRPTLSSQSSLSDSKPEHSVKFDDHVTMYGGEPEDEDNDGQYNEVANYSQKSIRYLGKSNPSKSFRMLQSLIGEGDETGGMGAPITEPVRPSMRTVKSRAAQRKVAQNPTNVDRNQSIRSTANFDRNQSNQSATNIDSNQSITRWTPTSPTAEFTSHKVMQFSSSSTQQRSNNSYTDF